MAKGGKGKGDNSSKKDKKDKKDKSSKKSGSKKDESEIDPEVALLWDENLRATVINDERWKCDVTILLQSKSEYTKFVEWFEEGAKAGSRRVIKNIVSADLILELKLSQGKKGMSKFHPLQGVCTAAAKSLSGGKVPVDILAKLLKYKIIRFKEADLSSKRAQILEERELQRTMERMMENDKKANLEGSEGTMGKKKKDSKGDGSEKSEKGGKKSKEKAESKGGKEKSKGDKKDKDKGGKGKKGKDGKKKGKGSEVELNECWEGSNLVVLDTPEKWNTKLRKRGEDWKDSHQIDDEPKDGADLYVVLTGFYDPNLLIELVNVGVPVNAVVKLTLDEEEDSLPPEAILSLEENRVATMESIVVLLDPSPKRNASMLESPCGKDKKQPASQRKAAATTVDEVEAKVAEIMKFWTDMQEFNRNRDNLVLLKDVALVDFPAPSYLKNPTNPEELLENQKSMYDIISKMLYEMERLARQHTNYVRNVKILNLEPTRVVNNLDGMEIYNTMVRLMPMECQSISFILHCMVEQAVVLSQETDILELLPPQQDIFREKSTDDGITSQKSNLKEDMNQKSKSKTDSITHKTVSTSKEVVPAKKPSSKVDPLSPRVKRSKERSSSKEVASVHGEHSVSPLELPVFDTSKINMVRTSLDTRVKELNVQYNLFQVPSPRAIRRDPLVILRGDKETLKSYHVALPEVDLAEIFENILRYGRVAVIWSKYKEQTLEERIEHDFHIHQLWNCMENRNLTLRMLKNHLHLLIFEKMEGNEDTFEINCNKLLSSKRHSADGECTGFMTFTDKLFKTLRKEGTASSGHSPIQTPLSEPPAGKHVLQKSESRSSRMECIGEMFNDPDIICLTDPLRYVLTGFRPTKQRETVLDLHKYTVVEEVNANIMLQNLFSAHKVFSSCMVQYYAPTDVVLMKFHNNNEKTDLVEASWMGKLTTSIPFRDFCEFVYEEETQWINTQEEQYQRQLKESGEKKKSTVPGEEFITGNEQTLLTKLCADEEFIKIGSIKHNDILKKQLEEQAQEAEVEVKESKKGKGKGKSKGDKGEKEPKEKKAGKGKKEKKEKKEKKGKSEKASKGGKSDKKKKDADMDLETEVEIPFIKRLSFRCAKEGEPHTFDGYDLDPFRFQIDGTSTFFFAPDQTEVGSEVQEVLFSNRKLIKTSVQKRGHTLYVYSKVDFQEPSIEKPFVFHLVSAFQCILAFGERQRTRRTTNIEPQPEVRDETAAQQQQQQQQQTTSPPKSPKEKGNVPATTGKQDKGSKSKQGEKSSNPGPAFETRKESSFIPVSETEPVVEETTVDTEEVNWKYDLRASWPNGLVLETVVGSSPLDPFHFKQKYIQKGPECEQIRNEEFRVFLRNGTILKFLLNGFVEVLCPDSTITVCKSFKKPEVLKRMSSSPPRRPKSPDCPEDVRLEGKELQPGGKDGQTTKSDMYGGSLTKRLGELDNLSPAKPEMEVDNYHVITPSGIQYTVKEKIDHFPNLTEATNDGPYRPIELEVDDNFEKFLLRKATDYELGEVFTRRGDGTNTLLMPDGSLIVVFPDGSRITTSYSIDEDPVMLEWTEEEMMEVAVAVAVAKRLDEERRRASMLSTRKSSITSEGEKSRKNSKGSGTSRKGSKTEKTLEIDKPSQSTNVDKKKTKSKPEVSSFRRQSISKSNSKMKDVSEKKGSVSLDAEEKPEPITVDPAMFVDEMGYVSVRMNCCLEHPNYATVSFNDADKSAEVDMPYDMNIKVTADGLYTANIDGRTQLEVQEDVIAFNCFVCPNCTTLNKTTLDLSGFRPKKPQKTSDEDETVPSDVATSCNIFCTTIDGWGHCHTITYDGRSSLLGVDNLSEDDEVYESESFCSAFKEYQCLPPSSKWSRRRCFVLHRDFTGEEMIHCDEAKTYKTDAQDMFGSSVITDKVPNKSGLRYHTIMCPILKTESQKWLMEYKSKYILPHNMRKKHLRSTYGDPPSWFHPFPKKQVMAVKDSAESDPPKGCDGRGDEEEEDLHDVMSLRILQEMESREHGDNVIAAIHEGLIKYWNAASNQFKEYVDHPAVDPRTEEEIEIEDQLLRAAMGQATVSVAEMFRRSHKTLGPKFGAMEKLQGRMSAHAAYLENVLHKKAVEEEEKEAYKAILRNRVIPPYFQSISGETFLHVLSAMDSAIEEVEEKNAELEENSVQARTIARNIVDDVVDNDVGEAEDVVGDIVESVKSSTMDAIGKHKEFESKRVQTS